MLSIERVKKILNDPKISDEEAENIRNDFRELAELIFEKFQVEHNQLQLKKIYEKNYDKKRIGQD